MNNQAHNYVVRITAFLPASHQADLGTVEAQTGQANPFKQLPKGFPWHNRRAKVEMAPSDKLLEQGRTLGAGRDAASVCFCPFVRNRMINLSRSTWPGICKWVSLNGQPCRRAI